MDYSSNDREEKGEEVKETIKKKKENNIIWLVIIGLIIFFFVAQKNSPSAQKERVKVVIDSNLFNDCPLDHPLLVTMTNNSDWTIENLSFHLSVYREGHSTDLSTDNRAMTDKIIYPGESYTKCATYFLEDKYEEYNNFEDLEFGVENLEVNFNEQ